MNFKKLYQVSLSLSRLGLNWKIKEFESYETEKTIVMLISDPNIDHKQKVIHKTTLNKLSDRITPSTTFIANSMYCYEDQLDNAKQEIHNYVLLNATKFKTEIDQLYAHITQEFANHHAEVIKEKLKELSNEKASKAN